MRCSKEGKRRGMRGQQREWRKGFKGLEGRRDRVSDGVGQARLDLGSSFGFLGAGPTRGRWMWAERWDHRQHDHVSREALHLARLLRSLPRVDSLGTNFTLMGVLFLSPPLPEAAGAWPGHCCKGSSQLRGHGSGGSSRGACQMARGALPRRLMGDPSPDGHGGGPCAGSREPWCR